MTDSKEVHIPIWHDDASAVLPMILKQDEVKTYALQLDFRYENGDPEVATRVFQKVIDEPFDIAIRINGKCRNYRLDFKRRQPVVGFNITFGMFGPGK